MSARHATTATWRACRRCHQHAWPCACCHASHRQVCAGSTFNVIHNGLVCTCKSFSSCSFPGNPRGQKRQAAPSRRCRHNQSRGQKRQPLAVAGYGEMGASKWDSSKSMIATGSWMSQRRCTRARHSAKVRSRATSAEGRCCTRLRVWEAE